jgi:hypothetical protein
MQTLGLSSSPQSTDGLFKRLFWPKIANQYDVDLVGQQGFWICSAVAVFSMAFTLFTGHAFVGALIGAIFFLGGLGVRQLDTGAAVFVFLCYLLDRALSVESMVLGLSAGGNPFLGIVATALLFANVRATYLSRRWEAAASPADLSEFPERSTTSFADKLANVLPEKLWPWTQYVFFPLAAIFIFITLLSMAGLPIVKQRRAGAWRQNHPYTLSAPQ